MRTLDPARIRKMGAAFLNRARVSEAYKRVFDTPDGKRVLADILERGMVLQTSIVAGAPDMTQANEGRRQLALEIVEQLRWNPMDVLALAEARADETTLRLGEDAPA